jgi:hypothetical protein
MKQKSDWKRITLLRKTSVEKERLKIWPVINQDLIEGPVNTVT